MNILKHPDDAPVTAFLKSPCTPDCLARAPISVPASYLGLYPGSKYDVTLIVQQGLHALSSPSIKRAGYTDEFKSALEWLSSDAAATTMLKTAAESAGVIINPINNVGRTLVESEAKVKNLEFKLERSEHAREVIEDAFEAKVKEEVEKRLAQELGNYLGLLEEFGQPYRPVQMACTETDELHMTIDEIQNALPSSIHQVP